MATPLRNPEPGRKTIACARRPAFGVASFLLVAGLSLLSPGPAAAQWTNVGVGIDYRQFVITMNDGKINRLFVSRMAVNNPDCIINGMIAQNKIAGAVETVPSQAARYEDAINYWGKSWGQRNDVVVAVNGSFWDISGTPIITGGQTYDGWYAKRFTYGGQTGFAWKFDRSFFIADCVKIVANQQTVTLGGGSRNYEGINVSRGANQLILYTPQYNNNTLTDNTGVEVLVELSSPLLMLDSPNGVDGTVRQVRVNQGSTQIPFDHVVLSGVGTAATFLQNRAQVGGAVTLTADVDHYDRPCTTTATTLANTYALSQGYFVFLRNGVIQPTSNSGMIIRNPRTFVAHNANYVFFAVCDGRSTLSAGMTSDEMGAFSRDHLGATDGVNQDGGGSSTMWVNGVVRNKPSDGNNRAVANGLMMVNLLPKQTSAAFTNGQSVVTSASASLRLGPGTDYYAFTTIAKSASGTVVGHQINGIYAKGSFWWKCNFSGTTGWIAESALVVPSSAPVITKQPISRTVAPGGATSFSVTATGTSPLTFRWQKNNANLSNGGHYSGVTTTNLTISNCDSNDAASYRCIVTNTYGSATSSNAQLIVTTAACTPGLLLNSDFEGATNANGVATGWIGYQRAPNPTTVWTIQADGVPPGGGLRYQQIANTSSTGGGGVRQNITGCTLGATYTISGWMRGNSTFATCTVKVSPSASADWSSAVDLDPPQTYSGANWTSFSGTVVALSTNMTIWLDGQTGGTGQNKAECFDSVTIACEAAAVPPPAPTASAATGVTSSGFTANWISAIGALGYRLDVATNNSFSSFVNGYQDLDAGNATSRNVTGLSAGKTYYYRVRAYNSGGTSGNSGNITVTTSSSVVTPPAPTASAATDVATTAFIANWVASSDATGYRLDVATHSSFPNPFLIYDDLDVGNHLSQSVTGLTAHTTYYYRVRAYNVAGTSGNSGTISVTTLNVGGVPPAPAANPPTSVTSSNFVAHWSTATGATGYRLDVSPNSEFSSFVSGHQNLDVGDVTSRIVNGLAPETTYFYRIRAYNGAGTSDDSDTADVTTTMIPPSTPTAYPATGLTTTRFTAHWSEASGASGYRLDLATDAAFTEFVEGYVGQDVDDATDWQVTGLTGGTTYYYRVRAYNAGGSSANSATISVTLPAPTPNNCLAIQNADFEGGFSLAGGGYIANQWTEWETNPGVIIGYDETGIVHSGSHAHRLRVWSGAAGSSGGAYQRIPATPGVTYTVRVWTYAGDDLTTCSLGVHPGGGTNAASGVIWSTGTTNVAWVQKSWTGVASTNFLTVFLRVASTDDGKRNGYFDALSPSTQPPPLTAARTGNSLLLTWPECPPAILEHTTNLSSPMSWKTVTNQVTVVVGQKQLVIVPSAQVGYFRLLLE